MITIPSKINKVEFQCQQVTKEMQGIQINGSIIWSIYRMDEGPYIAYKRLGSDITSNSPKTANTNLVSQASAIVRSVISNATLKQMLSDRTYIRDEVVSGMKSQVQGWGIWLESVEITDVKIMSSTLFKDLQAEFREQKKKDATCFTADIEDTIHDE